MRFLISVLMSMLALGLVSGYPVDHAIESRNVTITGLEKRGNPLTPPDVNRPKLGHESYCSQPGNWKSYTTQDSPLVSECEALLQNFNIGSGYDLKLPEGMRHQLTKYGNCTIIAEIKKGATGGNGAMFGPEDMRNMIKLAIDNFADHGRIAFSRVSVTGQINCKHRLPLSEGGGVDPGWKYALIEFAMGSEKELNAWNNG